jgi:hypothetical protein
MEAEKAENIARGIRFSVTIRIKESGNLCPGALPRPIPPSPGLTTSAVPDGLRPGWPADQQDMWTNRTIHKESYDGSEHE